MNTGHVEPTYGFFTWGCITLYSTRARASDSPPLDDPLEWYHDQFMIRTRSEQVIFRKAFHDPEYPNEHSSDHPTSSEHSERPQT